MMICKECGVELDNDITTCPLCGTPVGTDGQHKKVRSPKAEREPDIQQEKKHLMQRVLLQIVSVLLVSGIVATLIIDLAIHRAVTWSVYPVSICLILLTYALLISLWDMKIIFQLLSGWLISSLILLSLHFLLPGSDWPLRLAIPLLTVVNTIAILLIAIVTQVKSRGLNIFVLLFVAIAVLCLTVEAILSLYFKNEIKLQWSVIVAACLLPVTATMVFMHLRMKKNPDLQKIFHT